MSQQYQASNLISEFIEAIKQSLLSNNFVKISLGNYHGEVRQLKQIFIKRIIIKHGEKLSFTYRYKTRDEVKNFDMPESILQIQTFLKQDFWIANLFTTQGDVQLENSNGNHFKLRKMKATSNHQPQTTHDKPKNRILEPANKKYLNQLGITDVNGNVLKNAQDKFRQINHYLEVLRPLLNELPTYEKILIYDMGSGKGYLTFALYDYLNYHLKINAKATGVEMRNDMVTLCTKYAKANEFNDLHFVQGSINDFEAQQMNVLIALHACDTATDDAILLGIKSKADLIVVAPCCHKQIRKEMDKATIQTPIYELLKHGIFMERQAEMATDTLRALMLEYAGYKTKIFEFITDVHTPKNIMITASKKEITKAQQQKIKTKIDELKSFFGIEKHSLERFFSH